MTENTMREAFEKWATDNLVTDKHALETYWKMYKSMWQATQSVPVVGNPVAWKADNGQWAVTIENAERYEKRMAVKMHPLYKAPTTAITEAELERLWKCELLLREARDDVADQLNYMLGALAGYPTNDTRIQKQKEFLAAIDAAIAGEKK